MHFSEMREKNEKKSEAAWIHEAADKIDAYSILY